MDKVEDFAISLMLSCTKEEADEVVKYLRRLQYSFTHNDVPEALREAAVYLEDEPRTFVAMEK